MHFKHYIHVFFPIHYPEIKEFFHLLLFNNFLIAFLSQDLFNEFYFENSQYWFSFGFKNFNIQCIIKNI